MILMLTFYPFLTRLLPATDISPLSFCDTGSVPPLEFAEVTDDEVAVLLFRS